MNTVVTFEERAVGLWLQQASEVANLYSQAEEKIKLIEHLNQQLPIPSINELRYAGYHLVQFINSGSPEELKKAENHCKRAIYDAVEAGVTHQLEMICSFQKDFRMLVLSEHIPSYCELQKQLRAARDLMVKPKRDGIDRADYYSECTVHLEALRDCFETLESYREDLIKVLRRQNRQTIITWGGLLLTIIGVVFGALSYIKNPAPPQSLPSPPALGIPTAT
ncbi:MAG: hypothetical protein HYV16_13460 [Gammaproteobacteria bacterium]|nr:hypothetical protein [Gammaproteobacteria bacterium]